MRIISSDLLKKIDESKQKLDNSKVPLFIGDMFSNLTQKVIENASFQDADNKERRKEVIYNFKNGWSYAQKNYSKEFNLVYLTELAGRVEPVLHVPYQSYADYRDSSAVLKNLATPPIDKERIMTHLNRTIDSINKMNMHPLEEAIFLYLHLIRIQPFANGNKRTANIVMNTKLNKEGFLPISINPAENNIFLDYLSGAIEGFNESNSRSNNPLDSYINPCRFQQQFYDFLSKKELQFMKCAENMMEGLNQYDVNILKGGKEEMFMLKHIVDAYFRSRKQIGQVRTIGNQNLNITGDIPLQTLEKILNENLPRRKIKITEKQ